MKLKTTLLILGILAGSSPALGAGISEGCDSQAGRNSGQIMCDAGLTCTGPFEGIYGRGNCQKAKGSLVGEGCDTKSGRDGGQQLCAAGLACTGPFEGIYGHGNCQ